MTYISGLYMTSFCDNHNSCYVVAYTHGVYCKYDNIYTVVQWQYDDIVWLYDNIHSDNIVILYGCMTTYTATI